MSFLKKIFKPKPGGTFVGNLLRGASSSATGGALGQGSMLRATEIKNGWYDPNTGQYTQKGLQAMNAKTTTAPELQTLSDNALKGAMATKEGDQISMAGMNAKLKSLWENHKMLILSLLSLGMTFAVIWEPKGKRKRYNRR